MKLDKKAKSYEWGNGRFDLMTDEEVRTLTAGDFDMIFGRLGDLMQRGERYPDRDFRFEVLDHKEVEL